MKKKILFRAFLGFPLGVSLSFAITIFISLLFADGMYYPVVPQLAELCGSQIGAVLLQFCLSGLMGSACAAGSVIWQIERWGLLNITVIHFFILSFSILPVAYVSYWMPHSVAGILIYFSIFVGGYFILWLAIYLSWKRKIRKLNRQLQEKMHTSSHVQ